MTTETAGPAETAPADSHESGGKTLTQADLRQFQGTETWYRHPLNKEVLYTEGAQYVAEKAGAYWLLDEIALAQQAIPAVAAQRFQDWRLTVNADYTATLACEDGNCNPVYSKQIEYTDFPLEKVNLWVADGAIMLPSEY